MKSYYSKILAFVLALGLGLAGHFLFPVKAMGAATLNCTTIAGYAPRSIGCLCAPYCTGKNCGDSDGCGGYCALGACTGPYNTCGGGGTPNVCGCTPGKICPAGGSCLVGNGCGGACSCASGQYCEFDGICHYLYNIAAPTCSPSPNTNTTRVSCGTSSTNFCGWHNHCTLLSNDESVLACEPAGNSVTQAVAIGTGCGSPHGTYTGVFNQCTIYYTSACQPSSGLTLTLNGNNSVTANVPLSANGQSYSFACPAAYSGENDASSAGTYTCQGSTWVLTNPCVPECTAANICTSTCSGNSCNNAQICNINTANVCWFTKNPACPAGSVFGAGCPAGYYMPGGSCTAGYMCTTGPCT